MSSYLHVCRQFHIPPGTLSCNIIKCSDTCNRGELYFQEEKRSVFTMYDIISCEYNA